jgi:hypothetical protein
MNGAPFLLMLAVLQQTPSDTTGGDAAGSESDSSMSFGLGLEAGPLSFPSGTRGGGQDVFALASPMVRLENEHFAVELGAPLRFRLLDEDPQQTADDYGPRLRRQDWDTKSDYGQVLRTLRIGQEGDIVFLTAGPLDVFTLGEGHLVDRYDNQLSPDYHPAGAVATINAGPARVQIAASDVLSPRLFAAELRLDIGRLVSTDETHWDRFHGIASLAHDFGRVSEERTDVISAVLLGGNVALYKGEQLQLYGLAAGGTRVDSSTDIGAFGGFSLRGTSQDKRLEVSGRVEARYQGGNFRFGLFGPSYELARFSATGLSEDPLSDEVLERHLAGFGELRLTLGGGSAEDLKVAASASGEYFAFGRTDTDLALAMTFPGDKTVATARLIIVGVGTQPRYSVRAVLRQRLAESFYLWGSGSTLHFPQPDGTLVRGFSAGVGIGLDFSR